MDKVDRKIIEVLMRDARETYTDIGKYAGISRENVDYRVRKLQERGWIRSFFTHVNHAKLGFSCYGTYWNLQLDEETENKIKEYLISSGKVSWIGRLYGIWNYTFDIYVRDEGELADFLGAFSEQFSTIIERYEYFEILDVHHLVPGFPGQPETAKTDLELVPDATDLLILSLISENPRIKYTQLIESTQLTANAIKYRIKNLEKAKFILGYHIAVDFRNSGTLWHSIRISTSEEKKLLNYLNTHEHVVFHAKILHDEQVEFEVGMLAEDMQGIMKNINELKKQFGESIRLSNELIVLEETTANHCPEIVFSQKQVL